MEPYSHRYPIDRLMKASEEILHLVGNEPLLISMDHDYRYPSHDLFSWELEPKAEFLTTCLKWHVEEWWSQERARRAWQEYFDRLLAIQEKPADYAIEDNAAANDFEKISSLYKGPLLGADSHLWGLVVALALYKKTGKKLHIHHYDAHHDCGYINFPGDNANLSQRRARTAPSCDDWIQSAISLGIVEDVAVIYPNWIGMTEWYTRRTTLNDGDNLIVKAMPAATWFEMDRSKLNGTFFYARSSAYFPNWTDYDQTFLQTATQFDANWTNLDDMRPGGVHVGSANCAQVRD